MKNGKFEREGTISELKEKQGGFNVKLKLHNKEQGKASLFRQNSVGSSNSSEAYDEVDEIVETDLKFNNADELKAYFETKGEIKDAHPVSKFFCTLTLIKIKCDVLKILKKKNIISGFVTYLHQRQKQGVEYNI